MERGMESLLMTLTDRIKRKNLRDLSVMEWASPIPSFGDLYGSNVATLGINPSNREFVGIDGVELTGVNRRFHTLRSLGLDSWKDAKNEHYWAMSTKCQNYFDDNPYDLWFKKLDFLLKGAGASFYSTASSRACHLDLCPYATACKWTELTLRERRNLLDVSIDVLGVTLQISNINLIILNGISVVSNFELLTGIKLRKEPMKDWLLPRKSGRGVEGIAFSGIVRNVGLIKLDRPVHVLGYNHNIQSSFGVTSSVVSSIQKWITEKCEESLYETT